MEGAGFSGALVGSLLLDGPYGGTKNKFTYSPSPLELP